MRGKNSIEWAKREEITWMAKLLFHSPMTFTQLVVECQKHYGSKINKTSVKNQLCRLEKLDGCGFQKVDNKYQFGAELDEETLDWYLSEVDPKTLVVSPSMTEEAESKRWLTTDSLKLVLEIFHKVKESQFAINFNKLCNIIKASENKDLTTKKIEEFNLRLRRYFDDVAPFYLNKKGSIIFDFNKIKPDTFEETIIELIKSKKSLKDIEDIQEIVYEKEQLRQDEILFVQLVKDAGAHGIHFDKIPTRWSSIYSGSISKDKLSYISKDLLNKCKDDYVVKDKICYVRDLQAIYAKIDPTQLYVDVVVYLNVQGYTKYVPGNARILTKEILGDGTGYSPCIVAVRSKNDDELERFLRGVVAKNLGRIIYPSDIKKLIESEWTESIERFCSDF